jgi:uncharacterized integral membrane protein
MKHILKLLRWLFKAAVFFTLFAFALNNQQDSTVNFFFGNHWRAPLVLIVLAAFSAGVAVGVLGMLPGWLQRRKKPPVLLDPTAASLPAASLASHSSDGI